jgi:hypothetical protein
VTIAVTTADPNAGRLSRRTARRLWIAFGLSLLLIGAGVGISRVGLVTPRLEWPNESRGWEQSPDGVSRVQVSLVNRGLLPVTLVSVGRSGAGLDLLNVEGPLPVKLARDEGVSLTLTYRITDCAAASGEAWPVPAEVEWLWGHRTVDVAPALDFDNWLQSVVATYCHR